MDFDRARYFLALCDTGSIRRAAELIHLTPPALSKAVKTLEAELGVKLVMPAGRALRVTDRGLELARGLRPLLEQAARLEESLRRRVREEPLRIGSFEVFTTHFLGPLTQAFGDREVVLQELIPGQLEKSIVRRETDIGITYLPIPSPELDHVKACEVAMGVFAALGAFKGAAFADIPFVVPVQPVAGSPSRVQGLDGWPDDRVRRRIRFRVALMESALELCRRGLAAAYLPRFVVKLHNEKVLPAFRLVELPVPRAVGRGTQGVYLIKRKSDAGNPVLGKIRDVLKEELAPRRGVS